MSSTTGAVRPPMSGGPDRAEVLRLHDLLAEVAASPAVAGNQVALVAGPSAPEERFVQRSLAELAPGHA